jgi:hypothetical protein
MAAPSEGTRALEGAPVGIQARNHAAFSFCEGPFRTNAMITRHTCYLWLRAVLALVVALTAARASAQDPVDKPTAERSPLTRLSAPTSVTARQLSDGRIEVRWDAVDGAVKYDLWRSVPPSPQTMPTRSNPAETTYIDADVKKGSTYYYVVAAVTSGGISGLRAGSIPVTATIEPASASLRTSDPTTGATDGSGIPGTATATIVPPQRCQQAGAYVTCVTDTIKYSPLTESSKAVSTYCPTAGQVATGGGFAGNLLNMSVFASMPMLADAKSRAGWTVVVGPIRIPSQDPFQLLQYLGEVSRSFNVFVVCASTGTAP